MVPSVSSANMIRSLLALRTVPVNAKSIGSVMLSRGTAFASPTEVSTCPSAGNNAICAKKMDKAAFMDLFELYHRPSDCIAMQHTTNSCRWCLREMGVCCYYGHGKA